MCVRVHAYTHTHVYLPRVHPREHRVPPTRISWRLLVCACETSLVLYTLHASLCTLYAVHATCFALFPVFACEASSSILYMLTVYTDSVKLSMLCTPRRAPVCLLLHV